MFVHPDFLARLQTLGIAIKTCRHGHMLLTTAGQRERLPLKEARLTVDIGGFQYCGWFVLYKLAKYDLIPRKNWM